MRTETARTPGRRPSSPRAWTKLPSRPIGSAEWKPEGGSVLSPASTWRTPGTWTSTTWSPSKTPTCREPGQWDADMREEYANDLSDPDHLIAVTAGANRSKGAKGPEEWGPPDLEYWCQYATDWTEVKARWELTMPDRETEAVVEMLGTCENPPDMEVEELDYLGTLVGEHKPEPELQNSVYGSCEEAEAAGAGASELGVRVVRGSGGRRRGEGARKPGRWTGFPEGAGAERTGRGW